MEASNESDLKKWIEKELVISGEADTLSASLNSIKEYVKKYIRLAKDQKRIILLSSAFKLKREWQVYLYFVGKAYGTIVGIFQNYHVTAKELKENLKIPRRTLFNYLRKFCNKDGLFKLNEVYMKLNVPNLKKFLLL